MSDRPTYDVAIVGLDPARRRLVETVIRHVRHNRYAYRVAEPRALAAADLLVASVDDPAGRVALECARTATPWMPSIAVVADRAPPGTRHAVRADDLLRMLLPLLNRVVEVDGVVPGRGALRPRMPPTLPPSLAAPSALPVVPTPAATAATAASPPRPCVLLVGDEPSHRARVRDGVESLGLAARTADSGDEALHALASTRVDLAMLDWRLPDGEALGFARRIRAETRWRALPIVVLGTRASPIDVIRGAAAGCSAFLAKPVAPDDLRRTVARQLGRTLRAESLPPQLRTDAFPPRSRSGPGR